MSTLDKALIAAVESALPCTGSPLDYHVQCYSSEGQMIHDQNCPKAMAEHVAEALQAAGAVVVGRCGGCRHYVAPPGYHGHSQCKAHGIWNPPQDWYCGDFEAKEAGE